MLLAPFRRLAFTFATITLALGGCGDESGDGGGGAQGGSAGSGAAGTSGAAGASGAAGTGAGKGGSAGANGGTSGTSGTSGTAGAAGASGGSPNGGTSGQGGDAGSGATSGSAGSGNTGGSAAAGGSAGAAGSAGAGGSAGGGTMVTGPRFIGRFTTDNRFAWSGATIALRFTGTAISVTLNDTGDNFYDAVVDDRAPVVIDAQSGMQTYEIATGLSNGPHDVRVSRRTESFFNPSTFVSFSVPESAWLPQPVPSRRIEVIGDSISAGYGNEGTTATCPFEARTENHSLTYEAVAAKTLGADLHTEAWSGIGVYRNNDGNTTDVMPARFPRIIPTETGTTWDFSKFQPHAVIVNLGTNDYAPGDPGMAYRTAQQSFATTLRGHYPSARIYLAVGPMLGGAQYSAVLAHLQAVVQARNAAGDNAIAVIEFSTTQASEGYGCDYHPNTATHARMAQTLVTRLRADLGW